jgi:hypothetical protein
MAIHSSILFKKINDPNLKLDDDLFSEIEMTVSGNISDTWSRFKFTIKYADYVKSKEILEDELKQL